VTTTPGSGVRVEVIVPPTEQPATDCASGTIGCSAATSRHAAGMKNLTVPSSVADVCGARIRQNSDSYFGSNFSATPFMQ
jgi:uncharacterized OsmC-like protein